MRMWRAPARRVLGRRRGWWRSTSRCRSSPPRQDADLVAHLDGRAAQARADGGGVLGAVQLAVDEAAVVIDHTDHDGLAGAPAAVALTALAVWPSGRAARTWAPGRRRYAAARRPRPTGRGSFHLLYMQRRRRDWPWRLSAFEQVERCRPVGAASRMDPELVGAPGLRIACYSISDPATTDTSAEPAAVWCTPGAGSTLECPSLAERQRSRTAVTVLGEQRKSRAIARAVSARTKPRDHLPLRTRSEPTPTVRHVRPPSRQQSWRPQPPLEAGRDSQPFSKS